MAAGQVPLGIQQLISLDSVHVRQKSTFTCNKYEVMTPDNTVILYAREDATALGTMFGGKNRAFNINIFDTQDREIIRLRRPYTFGPDKMDVTVCGQLASVVRQQNTFLKPVLNVNDANDYTVFKVKGPLPTVGEYDFDVFARDKIRVGVISKKWDGFMPAVLGNRDHYVIRFPRDLDVRYKAAFIGTCLLIDFLYFGA